MTTGNVWANATAPNRSKAAEASATIPDLRRRYPSLGFDCTAAREPRADCPFPSLEFHLDRETQQTSLEC